MLAFISSGPNFLQFFFLKVLSTDAGASVTLRIKAEKKTIASMSVNHENFIWDAKFCGVSFALFSLPFSFMLNPEAASHVSVSQARSASEKPASSHLPSHKSSSQAGSQHSSHDPPDYPSYALAQS